MLDEALRTFRSLRDIFGCSPGVRSHNAFLDAFVRAGRWEEAESFFAYFTTGARVSPNLQSYNILIRDLCSRQHIDRAMELLQTIRCQGMEPDRVTYSTVMLDLNKSGDVDGAVKVFDEMCERNVAVDAVCYNVLISGLLKKGEYHRAMGMWERLVRDKASSPNVTTYNVMLYGLCKLGMFKEMLTNGHRPDAFTYGILIHGLCELGNVDGALQVCLKMIKTGFTLLHGFCKSGRSEESLKLWGSMENAGQLNIVSYNIRLRGLLENGRVEEAIDLWEHLQQRDKNVPPDLVTYGVLINGLRGTLARHCK